MDPTKVISSPTFCSTLLSTVIPIQFILESPQTALFPFLRMYLCLRRSSSLVSRPNAVSLLSHGSPPRGPLLFFTKLSFGLLHSYASPGWCPILNVINNMKLERLHRAANPAQINIRLNIMVWSPTPFGLGRNGCWTYRGSQLSRALPLNHFFAVLPPERPQKGNTQLF